MKKRILNFILAAGVVMGAVSCETDTIDDLTGVFQAPTDVTASSATLGDIVKGAATRTIETTITLDSGKSLKVLFVTDKYYLPATTYSAAENSNTKGTYVKESTTYGGTAVKTGGITLSAGSETWTEGVTYTISGTIWLTDGNIVRLSGSFEMSFEEDIEPYVMADTKTVNADNNYAHQIALYDALGVQQANIALNRAQGESLVGTYTIAENATADLTAGNGYDFRSYGWDVYGGTWYMNGESQTFVAAGGQIVVSKDDSGMYTFEVDGQKLYGKLPVEASCNESESATEGVTAHDLTIKNAGGETLAHLELYRTEGEKINGTYTVASYTSADLTMGNGYDLSAYGWGIGGTYYLEDGAAVCTQVGDTVVVTALGDTEYKVTIGEKDFYFSHE